MSRITHALVSLTGSGLSSSQLRLTWHAVLYSPPHPCYTLTTMFSVILGCMLRTTHTWVSLLCKLLRSHSGRERQMLLCRLSQDLATRSVKIYSHVP